MNDKLPFFGPANNSTQRLVNYASNCQSMPIPIPHLPYANVFLFLLATK